MLPPGEAERRRKERKKAYRHTPKERARRAAHRKWRYHNDPQFKMRVNVSKNAANSARRQLLKVCPHCGGEVSVAAWKLAIMERELYGLRDVFDDKRLLELKKQVLR